MKTLIPIPIGIPIEEFPLDPAFWPAKFMFCIMFFKTETEQLKLAVSLENIAGNISCEDNTKMTSPFRLDTNTQ